jgi:hypothetical protein
VGEEVRNSNRSDQVTETEGGSVRVEGGGVRFSEVRVMQSEGMSEKIL